MLGQAKPDSGWLNRHLSPSADGQACGGEQVKQGNVLARDGGGLVRVDRILAEIVDRDRQALADQPLGDGESGSRAVPGHEPRHHVPGQWHGRDQLADLLAGRGGQQNSAQHGSAPP